MAKYWPAGFNTFLWGLPFEDPKKVYAGPLFYAHPAGLKHERRWYSIPYLKIGQEIILEAEPHNPHDLNAVRLWTPTGVDLGYLPRAVASTVAFHLRRGVSYAGRIALVCPEEEVFYCRVAVRVERK